MILSMQDFHFRNIYGQEETFKMYKNAGFEGIDFSFNMLGNWNFEINPFPKTINEYLTWMNNQLEFVDKRNKRIERSLD